MADKKKKYSMKFKQLADIPQGSVMKPQDHASDNLAQRGSVPLGKSGDQYAGLMDNVSDEGHTGQ